MLEDVAKGQINQGFADDEMAGTFPPNIVEKLERVPADQRQNVMVEVENRALKKTPQSDGGTKIEQIRPELEVLDEVLEENGW